MAKHRIGKRISILKKFSLNEEGNTFEIWKKKLKQRIKVGGTKRAGAHLWQEAQK